MAVKAENLLDFLRHTQGNRTVESQTNLGDAKDTSHLLDVAFDGSGEVLGGADVARFQRAGKGASQSPGDAGDHVVERRRVFGSSRCAAVLIAVEGLDSAVDAKVDRDVESVEKRGTMCPLMLGYGHPARVRNGHSDNISRSVTPRLGAGPFGAQPWVESAFAAHQASGQRFSEVDLRRGASPRVVEREPTHCAKSHR